MIIYRMSQATMSGIGSTMWDHSYALALFAFKILAAPSMFYKIYSHPLSSCNYVLSTYYVYVPS